MKETIKMIFKKNMLMYCCFDMMCKFKTTSFVMSIMNLGSEQINRLYI